LAGELEDGAAGRAKFELVAPDNLTTYRIVAVRRDHGKFQFGGECDSDGQNTKPLLIDLVVATFFLRQGDEVKLRAVCPRQNFADSRRRSRRGGVTDANIQLLRRPMWNHELGANATRRGVSFKAKSPTRSRATKVRFEPGSTRRNNVSTR